MRVPKVMVIGSSYMDMAVKCNSPALPGSYVDGSGFSANPSGPGPNQAIEAAFCDCSVSIISCLGNDCMGEEIRKNLENFGVNTENIFLTQAKSTGTIITLVGAAGENICCRAPGANSALSGDHVASAAVEQAISEADCCLIDPLLSPETIITAIRLAQLHKTKTILNLSFDYKDAKKQLEQFPFDYYSVDTMVLEPTVGSFCDNSTNVVHDLKMLATDIVARGVKTVIMKCNRRGCLVLGMDFSSLISPPNNENSFIACGKDAFLGALAACFAVNDSPERAVKFALCADVLACRKPKSQENLPKKAEIIQLLQQ